MPADDGARRGRREGSRRRVRGKIAFVPGAGHGRGHSHAVRLAQEGADIVAVGAPDEAADDLALTVKEVQALDRRIVAARADVADRAALQAAFDAGAERLGGMDIVLADADLAGVATIVEVAVPRLVAQGRGGSIVLAGPSGVVTLARAYATNLAAHDIRVNAVHPTGTGLGPDGPTPPLDLIEPAEVSTAVLWLCSEEARYVTGVTLPVEYRS
jgi:NAD(P)-dependent dehydrogenase (short-subunit alcohol dehydrogenase family)